MFSFPYATVLTIAAANILPLCQEEILDSILNRSLTAETVRSDLLNIICDNDELFQSSICNSSEDFRNIKLLHLCSNVSKNSDLSSCPPGFHAISPENCEYCYQVSSVSEWDYPCFKSGGASVISDLNSQDLAALLNSLNKTSDSKYFWLPARRNKLFNPVTWFIPGPNWGKIVENSEILKLRTSIFKNCLLLDIEQQVIKTENCNVKYPSLCFYLNDLHYPAKCPNRYHAFRFMPDNGTCFGIEESDTNMSYDNFVTTKCKRPMGYKTYDDLTKFIYKMISNMYGLPENTWCWFGSFFQNNKSIKSIINTNGDISILGEKSVLPCIACETEIIYRDTELLFEYNDMDDRLHLTIYFPSGLWKYNINDTGIQCFSNAKGFVKVIQVNDLPSIDIKSFQIINTTGIEKVNYVINPITERSAQYWCEGHTKNFTLIKTNKVIVSLGDENDQHVFSLVLKTAIVNENYINVPDMTTIVEDITNLLKAEKIVVMDILEFTYDYMMLALHVHVEITNHDEDNAANIKKTFDKLETIAKSELHKYNYTFINMSSVLYCLPTTTGEKFGLDWEITPIGHIVAPKQFCLQANGLPVKRHCLGSFLLGSRWGPVEGFCDENYIASTTTKILYNFVTRQASNNLTSKFLTNVLSYVLNDVNSIIPADIYYLSVSLQNVLNIAHDNITLLDTGGISNIAWVIDRIMEMDYEYLRLAQTLNSTNVILDSINNFIELLASNISSVTHENNRGIIQKYFQVAVKPQFIVQVSYPKHNHIIGIAVSKQTESNNFSDMLIRPLYTNVTLEEVLSIENLEIASWLPESVLKTLKKNLNESNKVEAFQDSLYIVFSIFYNDAIFQELKLKSRVNSRIIGISIPGYISNLEYSVPIVFRDINISKRYKLCSYWNFDLQESENVPGYWSTQGCFFVKSEKNLTVCECYHLTHFGQLLQNNNNDGNEMPNSNHTRALNIITLVGSFLSLLGVFGIWITAIVFSSWRQKAGTQVLIQLSTSISIPLIILVIFNLDDNIIVKFDNTYETAQDKKNICIFLGALLHYSTLASFTWMLITAILQFMRYVRVLGVCRPSRFIVKCILVGWGIPLVPVIVVLSVDSNNYIPDSSRKSSHICYPSGIAFFVSVLTPVCLTLVINIVLFILVMHSISTGPNRKLRATDKDLLRSQIRLFFILFFLLGFTWFFGLLSFTSNPIWSYLFCLTCAVQDFVLFIYFVICDPLTRRLWINLMKIQSRRSSPRESVFSISSG